MNNVFSFQNNEDVTLFAFSLAPDGNEDMVVNQLGIELTGANSIEPYLSNFRLYEDVSEDGEWDSGSDVAVGGVGSLVMSGQSGLIQFNTPFTATTSNYIVVADVLAPSWNSRASLQLPPSAISAVGVSSGVGVLVEGEVSAVTHVRGGSIGGGGGGGARFGRVTAGDTPTTGGTDGGGGGRIDAPKGDTLVPTADDFAPTMATESEWNTPENVFVSDDNYATTGTTSASQIYQAFGMNLPVTNEVTGVFVFMEASSDTGGGTVSVQLSWDGGTSFTEAYHTPTLTEVDSVYSLGGESDGWGRVWTVSDFTDENFRLRLIANPDDNVLRVDALLVRPRDQATGGEDGGGPPPF